MRIIAGEWRGRKLVAPPGETTRPILDRVKASLFDWLGARLAMPGYLPPLDALDVFAGCGSLGLEALSRGASSCTFVESAASSLSCLRTNIEKLDASQRVGIAAGPAEIVLARPRKGRSFGLVFLDPPYVLSRDVATGSTMDRVVRRLGDDIPITPQALLVWRHEKQVSLPTSLCDRWNLVERKEWGSMAVTMYSSR